MEHAVISVRCRVCDIVNEWWPLIYSQCGLKETTVTTGSINKPYYILLLEKKSAIISNVLHTKVFNKALCKHVDICLRDGHSISMSLDQMNGGIFFVVSVSLSVYLLSTLNFAITFELLKTETSCLAAFPTNDALSNDTMVNDIVTLTLTLKLNIAFWTLLPPEAYCFTNTPRCVYIMCILLYFTFYSFCISCLLKYYHMFCIISILNDCRYQEKILYNFGNLERILLLPYLYFPKTRQTFRCQAISTIIMYKV